MNTRDEFRNVSVTEVGVVDTRYGVSQPVVSRRLIGGFNGWPHVQAPEAPREVCSAGP